jgi:hypothetical protein
MNAITGLPGPSVIVPSTVTATRCPLGGDSVAGLAATVMTGGILSTSTYGVARKPCPPLESR